MRNIANPLQLSQAIAKLKAVELAQAIAKVKNLSIWFKPRINALSFISGPRSGLAAGSLDITLEHFDAIVLLIDHGLTGSAFSLIRPMFESYVRGIWLLNCANDTQLGQFADETFNPKPEQMIAEIEQLEAFSSGALSRNWKDVKRTLHGLSHGGCQHRRMGPKGVGANYAEAEIFNALGYAGWIAIMSVIALAKAGKNDELARAAYEKMVEYSLARGA
jgi:hypothetical protein